MASALANASPSSASSPASASARSTVGTVAWPTTSARHMGQRHQLRGRTVQLPQPLKMRMAAIAAFGVASTRRSTDCQLPRLLFG